MKRLLYSTLLCLGSLGILSGCDVDDTCDARVTPPSNCVTVRPTLAEMRVEVSYTGQPQGIPLTIYRGRFDQGVVYARDTVFGERNIYLVPTNEYFSVAAEYVQEGRKIVAVDGVNVTVSFDDNCNYGCYTSDQNNINLRIRKYF